MKIHAIPIKKFAPIFMRLNYSGYRRYYFKHLKKLGIRIDGVPRFISSDCYFDSSDYSKIHIGERVTISTNVMFLTHDYSITNAYYAIEGEEPDKEIYISKCISVGNNSFIGARVILLPGAEIGKNCIIGAGAVIKKPVPDGSVVVGNPARVIGMVTEFAERQLKLKEFL